MQTSRGLCSRRRARERVGQHTSGALAMRFRVLGLDDLGYIFLGSYWGSIGIMEKKMETIGVNYRDYIGSL